MKDIEWIYVPARRCPRWPSDVSVAENTCGVCGHWRLAAEVRDVGSHYERCAVLVSARPVTVGDWARCLGELVGAGLGHPLTKVGGEQADKFCAWWFREHSEPCEGPSHGGPCDATCCGGTGRVLVVPCPACEGMVTPDEPTLDCRGTGWFRIRRIRPARRDEVEAAQTLCGLCSDGGHDRIGAVTGHAPCLRCGGRGYTGPEWVEGGLVLAGEVV